MDLKQGDLENIILNALWDLEECHTEKIYVGDVQTKIQHNRKQWAYTTVKTVLDRLVDKDIAVREKDGKKYTYRSKMKRDEAGLAALQKVMRQFFKNDVNEVALCLEHLSERQRKTATSKTLLGEAALSGNGANGFAKNAEWIAPRELVHGQR